MHLLMVKFCFLILNNIIFYIFIICIHILISFRVSNYFIIYFKLCYWINNHDGSYFIITLIDFKRDNSALSFLRVYFNHDSLCVEVLSARDVIPLDPNGLSDPFVVLELLPKRLFPKAHEQSTNVQKVSHHLHVI